VHHLPARAVHAARRAQPRREHPLPRPLRLRVSRLRQEAQNKKIPRLAHVVSPSGPQII
jgi:hypothetical protein